jgi:hypothetical protein
MALIKAQRLVSSRSQPPGWECISNGLLPLVKLLEAAAPPEWVPSLEAGNQLEQGLYLFLVPFGIGHWALVIPLVSLVRLFPIPHSPFPNLHLSPAILL